MIDRITIHITEGKCYNQAWKDWFQSGNEYGIRDEEYLQKGLDKMLNFVMIAIKKKN